jgi:hypothetical protein
MTQVSAWRPRHIDLSYLTQPVGHYRATNARSRFPWVIPLEVHYVEAFPKSQCFPNWHRA